MKKLILLIAIVSTQAVLADLYLIEEMENLKASLHQEDKGRQELTLRLADLYFDVSIQEGEEVDATVRHNQRKRALELYTDVLARRDGLKGVEPKREIMVTYQVARVYRKLNQYHKAKAKFLMVFNSELADKTLKREAAFSIAEYYEEEANFNQADKYYQAAIGLCETKESCNLSHYKRAWLLYKELKIDQAIGELKLALFDRKGQVREKIINDLMLFFSNRTTDGTDELAFIKDLAQKTKKPELIRQLVESFYSAGNRVAGAYTLVYLNQVSKDIFYEMRLLEEYYGFRDWDEVNTYLTALEKRQGSELPSKPEAAKEFKAMLKRVIVQFGSEAEEDPKQYNVFLRRAIDLYLGFYQNDEMRIKLQQGWLKAQPDKVAKVKRLKKWIFEDIKYQKETKHIRKLRQTRLALAQDLKLDEVILEEALEISELLKETEEAREFNYIVGLQHYKNKNYDLALKRFLPLAQVKELSNADKWSTLSQNLSLDIYNIRKDFKSLSQQASSWLSLDQSGAKKDLRKELAGMKQVKLQAEFEYYASLGQDQRALDQFYRYCFEKVFEKKSCSNAKVLSIQLKDQAKLVKLLEREQDESALIVEYERMGEFVKAAKLHEKLNLNKNSELVNYLKVAALYEIGRAFESRDRILKQALNKFKKPLTPALESAFFNTLSEADLLNERMLILPWSVARKIEIANIFGESKTSQNFIAGQKMYAGKHWSKMILNKAQSVLSQYQKYNFYGRRSEIKFKRKVKQLENFVSQYKPYLEPADLETRIYLLDMFYKAYLHLGSQIMATPIPEGLTEEIMMQVQVNLTNLASPYLKVAEDYQKLLTEQLNQTESKLQYETSLQAESIDYAALVTVDPIEKRLTASLDYTKLQQWQEQLKTAPDNVALLEQMKSFYQKNGFARLAGYFQGRIEQQKGNL